MVIFVATTGLRPAEWLALERRDVDRGALVVYVRRAFTKGRLKCTKTEASRRAVPLQAIALDAIDRQPPGPHDTLLSPPSAAVTAAGPTSDAKAPGASAKASAA
jgi:integrase